MGNKERHISTPAKRTWNIAPEYEACEHGSTAVSLTDEAIRLVINPLPASNIGVVVEAYFSNIKMYMTNKDSNTIFIKTIPGGWNSWSILDVLDEIHKFSTEVESLYCPERWE